MQWQILVILFFSANLLTADVLHLKTGDLQTTADLSAYHTDVSLHFRPGRSHYLLQFNRPADQGQLSLLAARAPL